MLLRVGQDDRALERLVPLPVPQAALERGGGGSGSWEERPACVQQAGAGKDAGSAVDLQVDAGGCHAVEADGAELRVCGAPPEGQ